MPPPPVQGRKEGRLRQKDAGKKGEEKKEKKEEEGRQAGGRKDGGRKGGKWKEMKRWKMQGEGTRGAEERKTRTAKDGESGVKTKAGMYFVFL
jgi:hypothetical protein